MTDQAHVGIDLRKVGGMDSSKFPMTVLAVDKKEHVMYAWK